MQTNNRGKIIAIGTRSHVMFSRLLTADQYWAMLNFKSTPEIASFLNDTEGYKGRLPMIINSQTHRIDLEIALRSEVLAEGDIFMSALSGSHRTFFLNLLGMYEIENLKSIFRWIRSRRLARDEMRARLFKVPGSKLPYDALLNSADFRHALSALDGTKYPKAIADHVADLTNGKVTSLFSLEQALDFLYEKDLFASVQGLPTEDRAMFEPIFGERADMLNLYTLHRCATFYNMIVEETLSHMMPIKYKIQMRDLRKLAACEKLDDRMELLRSKFRAYAEIFSTALGKPDEELAIEIAMKRHLHKMETELFKKGTPGFHTAMAYFLIKSHEVDDVIRIVEEVRYNYDRRSAGGFLIRPILSGGEPVWQ